MPALFAIKGRVDAVLNKVPFLPKNLTDRTMQLMSKLWPAHLPARMTEYRDKYEHHLMLRMADSGIEEASTYLKEYFKHATGIISNVQKKKVIKPFTSFCRRRCRGALSCRSY